MAPEYGLQELMNFRRKRVESLKRELQTKQSALEEQRQVLAALEAEEGLLCEPPEVEAREQHMQRCREAIETLQRELQQVEHDLEQERKELWILQMHKDKWLADQSEAGGA
jgi:hypothetical protein